MKYYLDYILRHDLLKHFYVGFFTFVLVELLFSDLIALIAVAIIAVGKELIYDKLIDKGTPEVADVVYTITPAIILMFVR